MKLLKFSNGDYLTFNGNYKYSNYNISLGTKIGAGLGALRGATVKGMPILTLLQVKHLENKLDF
jgi:hypothetical protein